MVVVLSVAVATLVGPALLTLVGPNIDRWRIGPAPNGERSRLMLFVNAALKRPAARGAADRRRRCCSWRLPAIGLKTGPPSPEQLPQDSPSPPGRRTDRPVDRPRLRRAVPGRRRQHGTARSPTPRASPRSTTSSSRIAKLPGVQAGDRPERGDQAGRTAAGTRQRGALLRGQHRPGQTAGPTRPQPRTWRRRGGATARRASREASAGAGLLRPGSDRAGEGAQMIATGLGRATSGSERAIDGAGHVRQAPPSAWRTLRNRRRSAPCS